MYQNVYLIVASLILLGLNLNNLFLDSDFIYEIFEMVFTPTQGMVAPGLNASDLVLGPIPSVHDEDYGMFRVEILILGLALTLTLLIPS